MNDKRKIERGQIYRHFKGNLYQIVAVAKHSETQEEYVVYQALYGEMGVWIRPLDMFMSEVDHNKYPQAAQKYRFELLPTISQNMESQPQIYQSAQVPDSEISMQKDTSKDDTPQIISHSVKSELPQNANEKLMTFLEFDTVKEKLEYLRLIRNELDDRLINDIAMSMDVMVEEGDIDMRYASLCSALETMARFECTRLRS